MKNCPQCGQPRQGEAFKCPRCDIFYSKIDEILFEQQVEAEKDSFNTHIKAILASDNITRALTKQLKSTWKDLSLKAKFTLWVIFVFVFWGIIVVL
ncbi:MAG: hypothetical protein WC782_09405 [Methylococcaceae bacterium]|jgi:hypothetical protein